MIGYLAVCFAYIAVNYLMALFFLLLFLTFTFAAGVVVAIKRAAREIRKASGFYPADKIGRGV